MNITAKNYELILEATRQAEHILTSYSGQRIEYAMQALLDTSSLDCNKPIVTEMLALLMPQHSEMLRKLNTDSHRTLDILFPVGAVCEVCAQHDNHNYQTGEVIMVSGYFTKKSATGRTKEFMIGLRATGDTGTLLFIYNPTNPIVKPIFDEQTITGFIEALPDTIVTQSIIQKVGL